MSRRYGPDSDTVVQPSRKDALSIRRTSAVASTAQSPVTSASWSTDQFGPMPVATSTSNGDQLNDNRREFSHGNFESNATFTAGLYFNPTLTSASHSGSSNARDANYTNRDAILSSILFDSMTSSASVDSQSFHSSRRIAVAIQLPKSPRSHGKVERSNTISRDISSLVIWAIRDEEGGRSQIQEAIAASDLQQVSAYR